MVRRMLKCRLVVLLVVLLALMVGVVSLAGAERASSAPAYTRTVVYTFSTTYAMSVAAAANGDVIAGVMGGNPAFSCLCRISNGEGTHVHPYEGGSPQIYDVEVDSAGQYIVAEVGPPTGAVAKISPTGTRTQIYSPGSGKTVLGVDVDTDGGYIALVVDFAGAYQALVKIDAEGSVKATYPLPPGEPRQRQGGGGCRRRLRGGAGGRFPRFDVRAPAQGRQERRGRDDRVPVRQERVPASASPSRRAATTW